MKKVIAGATSLALALSINLALPTAAAANNGAKDTVDFCKAFIDGTTLDLERGGCISFYRTDDPVSICKAWKDYGVLELLGFNNQGDCIKALSD